MSVESIHRFCLSFPHATENLQWGDNLCFKVGGKIFTMLSLSSVPTRLMFKSTPEKFAELLEYEDIIPAPYVGRYKWVSFQRWMSCPGLR
jgi:predicted DNA-binding protein (MmcQ/YjbR family)